MRARSLILALLCCATTSAFAQTSDPKILVDGNPPLTVEMASDYQHFMQWALRTPMTAAQQARIQNYLVTSWKQGNLREITRTVDLLALRDRIKTMELQDSHWAPISTGRMALHYWNQNSTTPSALWGLAMYRSTHTPLIPDNPPLYRQMEDSYEEMGYFMMTIVDGNAPIRLDAVARAQLADSMAATWKKLTPEQKTNFSNLPQAWYQVRNAWPTLDDATKASLKADWKAHFFPQPKPSKPAKGKAAPPATPPSKPEQPLIRLAKMTWIIDTDSFSKVNAVGTPYTNGW